MAYVPGPLFRGNTNIAKIMLGLGGQRPSVTFVGDSYAVWLGQVYTRLPLAICATAPWGGYVAMDLPHRVTGEDGDYNFNSSDNSNTSTLLQIRAHGSFGDGDIDTMWAVNSDNGFAGYSNDGGSSNDFAHYGLFRENPIAFTYVDGVSDEANAEYARYEIKHNLWAESFNKLKGPTNKTAIRYCWVSASSAGNSDATIRRLVDVGQTAPASTVTLSSHPVVRFTNSVANRAITGSLTDTESPRYGARFSATMLTDVSGSVVNSLGDYVLEEGNTTGCLVDGNMAYALRGSTDISEAGDWQPSNGCLAYPVSDDGEPLPNLAVFRSWGVPSASYSGVASSTTSGKNFTAAQAAEAVRLTSLDLDQPHIYIYHFADEDSVNAASIQADLEALVAANEAVGITNNHILLVVNPMHGSGADSEATVAARIEANRDAFYEIQANSSASILVVSLYDLEQGIYADGDADAQALIASLYPDPTNMEWGDNQTSNASGADFWDPLHISSVAGGAHFALQFWRLMGIVATDQGGLRAFRAPFTGPNRARAFLQRG